MTVKERLTGIFQRYGLPRKMLMDNGSPWGSDAAHPYTPLTVWLLRLGVQVGHSGPYHPQTLGKDERFHRTLEAELLQYCRGLELEGPRTFVTLLPGPNIPPGEGENLSGL